MLQQVGAKLLAAAYTAGGPDYGALFDRFDDDNNGTLSVDELVGQLRKVMVLSAEEACDVFAAFDKDGDGEVDREEFAQFCTTGADASGFPCSSPTKRRASHSALRATASLAALQVAGAAAPPEQQVPSQADESGLPNAAGQQQLLPRQPAGDGSSDDSGGRTAMGDGNGAGQPAEPDALGSEGEGAGSADDDDAALFEALGELDAGAF